MYATTFQRPRVHTLGAHTWMLQRSGNERAWLAATAAMIRPSQRHQRVQVDALRSS